MQQSASRVSPTVLMVTLGAVAAIALGVAALSRGGDDPGTTIIDSSRAGTTVTVDRGSDVVVTLPANPSTGYSWVVSSSATLTQTGEPQFTPESNLVGAAGTMTFRFEAVRSGEGVLQLDYLRPWEEVAPLDTFSVTIRVR